VRRGTKGEGDGNFKTLLPMLEEMGIAYIARVTGDCPLICPNIVDCVVDNTQYRGLIGMVGYCSRSDRLGERNGYPPGQDVEAFNVHELMRRCDGDLSRAYADNRMQPLSATREQYWDYNTTIDTRKDYDRVTKFLEFCAGKYTMPITFPEQARLWEEWRKYAALDTHS
jgi:spore coat polysaccharide biosynthesis protein SpsF (cytidylyltransferase family)